MTPQSFLFVPGDRADMLAKAGERGADAIIADLEDAVAPSRKAAARASLGEWLSGLSDPGFEAWVRIDGSSGEDGVIGPDALTGLMVPKVGSADELHELSLRLDRLEAGAGLPEGRIHLIPIVETARSVQAVDALAAAPRVRQLMIGELDLGAELGIDPANTEAFVPLRMAIVVASAAAGIDPPLGPVYPDFRDLEGLAADTARLVRMGFGARPAIHPAQIPVINRAFAPAPKAVERARRLVTMYEAALAEGRGAVTDEDGRMVDEAVVRAARRLLDADRTGGAH